MQQTDCYGIGHWLQLTDSPNRFINVLDRASHSLRDVETNKITFYESRQGTHVRYPSDPFCFVISRPFLDELAADLESPRIAAIDGFATPFMDPTLAQMALNILPYVKTLEYGGDLYADHFMLAYAIYICATYGNLVTPRRDIGCLTQWQERLAKEMIEAHLNDRLRLSQLAAACGLRTSQFAHAFRKSVGLAPHQWLSTRRIERAKNLLRGARSLADVALMCGYSDQSHLTRAFRRAVGVTPGYWRSQQ